MKLAIVGSRELWVSHSEIRRVLKDNFQLNVDYHIIEEIVTGGAEGIDDCAISFAKVYGIKRCVFHPDWVKHGKSAGPRRNKQIVDYCDVLIAFWDGKSRGTKSSISLARAAKKTTVVYILHAGGWTRDKELSSPCL